MGSNWFEEVQRVFHKARGLDGDARAAFLDRACAGDDSLRKEVESLLQVDSTPDGDFMKSPVLGEGFRVPDAPASDEGTDERVPEIIGQYRILDSLGVGGMGAVYRAEQEKTGSIVALKVIRPGITSREILRRFEHEAHVLGRMRHPGIGRVYEAGIHSSDGVAVPFIAMELIDGPTLLEYVQRESPDTRTILELFAMICDAVHHAHQKGVIHRDLKPSNILVERADQSVQPKILDFGIARITDGDTQALTIQTHTGQLLGTVKYMSPEQAAGDPTDIDTRSDVYALGVILYELLARQLPYEVDRKLLHEAVRTIREDEARPLSSISSTYRGDLTTILGKALEKDKTRRYQSAHGLATDIRRYMQNEPIAAHPPSAMYQLHKFARRNRGLVAGVAVIFVLLVAGIITTSWQATAASKARDEAQAARLAEQKQRERAERRFKEVRTLAHSLSKARDEAQAARLAEQEQRERAERRFKEVRTLAHSLVFEFDQRVRHLAGATPARELLVKQGLEYLNSVAEEIDPDDVQFQTELGGAYFKLGDVQGDPMMPNLGDPEGALKSYLKGLSFLETAAASQPDELDTRRSLALGNNRIGQLLVSMGRREEAGEYYRRARHVLVQLRREFPQNVGVLRELGNCYDIQATAHKLANRLEDAQQAELDALDTLRAALELEPDHILTRHAVASTNSQLARILEMQGKPADALEHHRQCLTILETLVTDEPHNAAFRRSVGVTADNVGILYKLSGHFEQALSYFQRASEIAEQLLAADPNYERAQADLLRTNIHLGEAQLALGRTAAADETFRELLKLSREYAERNINDADAQRQLGVAYYKMAELEITRAKGESQPDQSRTDHWREAIRWLHDCQAVFIDMKDRGILASSDSDVPDEISEEIDLCKSELATLAAAPRPTD